MDTPTANEQYKGPGWWLPDPHDRPFVDNGPTRNRKFKWIGGWVIRLWLTTCFGFSGLLYSAGSLNFGQVFFGTVVFTGGTGLLLTMFMSMAWFLT